MNTQNTETPWIFIKSVEDYFGITFKYDLAGDEKNKKAPFVFTEKENSLSIEWPKNGWCWLNPPFGRVNKTSLKDWVYKCDEQMRTGAKIVSIWTLSGDLYTIPAWRYAYVYIIHGRIWPLVRGCMLCLWDENRPALPEPHVSGLIWERNIKLISAWE